MDASRLDALAKALAGTGSRRAALRLLAGGLLGGLLAGRAPAGVRAACTAHGDPCKRNGQCCSSFCDRHHCRCPQGTISCDATACCGSGTSCVSGSGACQADCQAEDRQTTCAGGRAGRSPTPVARRSTAAPAPLRPAAAMAAARAARRALAARPTAARARPSAGTACAMGARRAAPARATADSAREGPSAWWTPTACQRHAATRGLASRPCRRLTATASRATRDARSGHWTVVRATAPARVGIATRCIPIPFELKARDYAAIPWPLAALVTYPRLALPAAD
jgi:hypothetical protein